MVPYQQNLNLDTLSNYMLSFYPKIFDVFIKVIAAVIIFILGWLIAYFIKLIVEFILEKVKFSEWFKKVNLDKYFENFDWEERLDKVLSEVIFWVVLVVFLMTSFDILGFQVINRFIESIIDYLPNVIAGGLILLAGFIFGELLRKILSGFLKGIEKRNAQSISLFVKYVIIIFSFLTALSQWGIANEIINILVLGVIIFFALAGGLAFGLGGQNLAKEILENFRKQIH